MTVLPDCFIKKNLLNKKKCKVLLLQTAFHRQLLDTFLPFLLWILQLGHENRWLSVFFGFLVVMFFVLFCFLIGLDQTGKRCALGLATSSKRCASHNPVAVQGDGIAVSSGWCSHGTGSLVSIFTGEVLDVPSHFVEKYVLEECILYRQDLHFWAAFHKRGPPISHFNFLPGIFFFRWNVSTIFWES